MPRILSPRRLQLQPGRQGRTVIRAGVSTLFAPMEATNVTGGVLTDRTAVSRAAQPAGGAASGLKYPIWNEDAKAVIGSQGTGLSVQAVNPGIDAPYSFNFYFGLQRELARTLMIESAFVGNRGIKFQMTRDYNQVNRLTGIRPNPNIGTGQYTDNSENTRYFSWQTSLRQRPSRHLTANAHYTWGKAISYGIGDVTVNTILQDFFDIRINRARPRRHHA